MRERYTIALGGTMSRIQQFNAAVGVKITNGVSTMWCAYAFAAIALVSLPQTLASDNLITIVSWLAQTFLQLVLLSIIMVGQDVKAKSTEQKINETHEASLAEFELAKNARANAALEFQELKEIAKALHARIVAGDTK
jgi:hypothetical protein